MLSVVFYGCFILLFFVTFICSINEPIKIIYTLLISSQFNVTSFFKLGITFSFFEINLIIAFFVLIFASPKNVFSNIKYKSTSADKIFFLFLILSISTIFIAIIRVLFGNLLPDLYIDVPFYFRGLMSLNKIIIFLPILIFLRTILTYRYNEEIIRSTFIKGLILSGIFPSIASIIQFSQIGFNLIHNNPSFSEIFRIEDYRGQRIVGLTNEASFFVYQLFFPTLSIYYAWINNIVKKSYLKILVTLFISSVIISISRTGLFVYIIFLIILMFKSYKKKQTSFLKISLFLIPVFFILINISIIGFNLFDRLISTFDYTSDSSTMERYGSMQALFDLFINKSMIVGVGIYNYQYYIKSYLPDYMSIFNYGNGDSPPSFNFIFQIFVEFGLLISLFFFFKTFKYLKFNSTDSFIRDWFLYLFIFSLSFQTLNFSVPFLILLYPPRLYENTLCYR